jgi:stage II sporulation protein P
MKRTAVTLNLNSLRKTLENASSFGKLMLIGSVSTLLVIVIVSLSSVLQSKSGGSSVSSFKGLAANVSNQFFVDMLGMEVPGLKQESTDFTFSGKNILYFMVRFLTDLNPADPQSILAHEIPGMNAGRTTVLRPGKVDNPSDPLHLSPPASVFEGAGAAEGIYFNENEEIKPVPAPIKNPSDNKKPIVGQKIAFVYQSHSTESFLPELTDKGITNPDLAYDSGKNISLVGQKLTESLQNKGVETLHSKANYPKMIKNYKHSYAYKYANRTLQEVTATNSDLQYFFDIHRDSSPRKKTTVSIEGKDYAQVYFVIGAANPNWKKNEAFANQIHEILEKNTPGLSKGIYAKTDEGGNNGVYNQNISPTAILIEIGGPDNTLEETYRTVELLSSAISEVILKAEKVNG